MQQGMQHRNFRHCSHWKKLYDCLFASRRNTLKTAIQSRTLIWKINITTVRPWKRTSHWPRSSRSRKCLISRTAKRANGALRRSNKWSKSISSCWITPKWWCGTNNCWHTSRVRSPETIRRNPSIPFWTTFPHRRTYAKSMVNWAEHHTHWVRFSFHVADGIAAKFLRDHTGSVEGCQKWSSLVQNKHQIGQTVFRSKRFRQIAENIETIAPIVSGEYECYNMSGTFLDCLRFVFRQTDDGEDDLKKGTQLLEIYALEIQMYTVQKNNKKLKALYEQSLHIKSAIPHPLIMGVIRGTQIPQRTVLRKFNITSMLTLCVFLLLFSFVRMRRKNAFARRRVREGPHRLLRSVQELRRKRIGSPYHMSQVFGFGKHVSN